MSAANFRQPKYRLHKASGQAIVQFKGRRHYLGPHGSEESWQRYYAKLSEFRRIADGEAIEPAQEQHDGLTIVELVDAYWLHAETWYCKHGEPTGALENVRLALKPLKDLYGRTPAEEFGPLKLDALREQLIDQQLCRKVINERVRVVKQVFKWGASKELIPGSIYHALASLSGLKQGRTRARDTKPVAPIDDATVEATLPHLPDVVADMVRFQRLTICRPGEVFQVRPADVDRSGSIWEYRPRSHKTEHHGRERIIFIGPKAQAVLLRYLARDAEAYCFSPADSEAKRRAEIHLARVTPLSCGNRPGTNRKRRRSRPLREIYDKDTYRKAIIRGCDAAFPPPAELEDAAKIKAWRKAHRWSPNRLRHTGATECRKQFGLEGTQVVLGHSKADVTQIYAERNNTKARSIMAEVG